MNSIHRKIDNIEIKIYSLQPNIETINKFADIIVQLYQKKDITNYFQFSHKIILPIFLEEKKDLDQYILKISSSYKEKVPNWVIGFTNESCIHMMLPTQEHLEYDACIAIHELVHLLSYQLEVKGERIKLLEEGLATYIAGQMTQGQFDKIIEDYNRSHLLSIRDLLQLNSTNFGENKGYYYAFFFIKFLKNTYGKEKIKYYIVNPQKFYKDIDWLEKQFKDFLISLCKLK